MTKQHIVFDVEIIGSKKPVFLVCTKSIETQETHSFWLHKKKDMQHLESLITDPDLTWVSFNGINFDAPLIAAAIQGADEVWLKDTAQQIIEGQMKSWQTYRQFGIEFIEFDHIDLIETAPGVQISLKTYAGRLAYPSMVDMPFHHTWDLTKAQHKVLEQYCLNDLGVTEALFNELREQLNLREQMGAEYDMDLRSKSDAQIAEAILKKQVGIKPGDKFIPQSVSYTTPDFIQTKSEVINDLIIKLEDHPFRMNRDNGSPELPDWLSDNLYGIGSGTYQVGLGGLHSTHDKKVYYEADDKMLLSDFDVASYYPNIIMKCGLIPKLGAGKGERFLEEYQHLYEERMKAKRAGDKATANTLKIVLNGTFGKLGSIYCSFYSPDLMLATTLTGQLNLMCLIYELTKIKGVEVCSANTDGILVKYPAATRDKVLKVFSSNARKTGFEYEETPYLKYAAKDVNNYLAITTEKKVKRKGEYGFGCVTAPSNPQGKNPTMQVCSDMAVDFLLNGHFDITKYTRPKDFVAVRNIKGGGVQHLKTKLVDAWVEIEPKKWVCAETGKENKPPRKSRPKPLEVGFGGKPFGRVARWYMTTEKIPPITYVNNGNQVPKTEGAKLCLTLPDKLPKDVDFNWYVNETLSMLKDMGVPT